MHGVSGSVTHRPSALAPRGQHVPAPAALLEGDKLLDSMAGYGNLSQRPSALGAATAQGADSLSWEGLRKDARKLEGELDMRLAAYSKLGARGSKDVSEASANAAEAEIESLLSRLGHVNDRMASAGARGGAGAASAHTLARHRDILQEFSQEFRRVRSAVAAASEHARLLAGAHKRNDSFGAAGGGSGLSQSQIHQQLLRERSGLQSATNAADEVIGQAQSQAQALAQQRALLIDIDSKVGTVGGKMPVLGSIMQSIRRKKSRDQLILSAVVAVCILFTLIYMWSK
eukprot:CAMPEP_0119177158 /NCGR_PEP_ID=MMETSP1315-20130426/47895_1 /TAXON_ID=676789 /ORGANISM="Prasinoderma singularis, Strain RCC927" /LENGTH=286 /DNA_ID=CAMNT_0007171299 /DNA_START=150 /DNA_END=1010 /DNA_ORIENTATION=-